MWFIVSFVLRSSLPCMRHSIWKTQTQQGCCPFRELQMTLHTEDTQECGRPAVVNSLGFGTVTGINYSWFLNQILSNSTTFEERTLHFFKQICSAIHISSYVATCDQNPAEVRYFSPNVLWMLWIHTFYSIHVLLSTS